MKEIDRRMILALAATAGFARFRVIAAETPVILYKNPQCDCCEGYADYLRKNGFVVHTQDSNNLATISRNAGIPEELEGCHISMVEGYVVAGHVPIAALRKLLAERPPIKAITLPGMPMGSPGMGGTKQEPFVVYAIARDGSSS